MYHYHHSTDLECILHMFEVCDLSASTEIRTEVWFNSKPDLNLQISVYAQFTSPFNYYMFSIKVHCLLLILAMVPWKGACWSSISLVVISHINAFVFHRVSYQVQRCSWSNLAHVPFVCAFWCNVGGACHISTNVVRAPSACSLQLNGQVAAGSWFTCLQGWPPSVKLWHESSLEWVFLQF